MHCAVLFVRRGRWIHKVAVGFNSLDAHAETEAMRAWLRQSTSRCSLGAKLELVVWRIRHSGAYASSKPCWNCVQALHRHHLRLVCPSTIWYTHEQSSTTSTIVLARSTIERLLSDPDPHLRRSCTAYKT
jgi:hypothetical protein